MSNITPHFKGVIAISNLKHSWCAGKQELLPGFYCLDIINNDEDENRSEYEDEDRIVEDEEEEY